MLEKCWYLPTIFVLRRNALFYGFVIDAYLYDFVCVTVLFTVIYGDSPEFLTQALTLSALF